MTSMSVRLDRASNMALERTAGSHSLAAAAHRERWTGRGGVYV
jgi:hypothetical protein